MTMRQIIAVFMKDEHGIMSLPFSMTVIVFEKSDTLWGEVSRCYVNISAGSDLVSYRAEMRKTLDSLGDCRVAAGSEMSGVLFRELHSRGYSVFEIDSYSPEILDGILSDLSDELQVEASTQTIPTKPYETQTPGVYQLDLVRLQEAYPEMTSKQALREFLDSTPFYELKLICTHLPPWIESGPYEISLKQAGVTIISTIRKKQCKGG